MLVLQPLPSPALVKLEPALANEMADCVLWAPRIGRARPRARHICWQESLDQTVRTPGDVAASADTLYVDRMYGSAGDMAEAQQPCLVLPEEAGHASPTNLG